MRAIVDLGIRLLQFCLLGALIRQYDHRVEELVG